MSDRAPLRPPVPGGLSMRGVVAVCYVLMLIGCLNGLTAFIGVIIAYVKRPDAAGTVWASHFGNIILMFWVAIVGGILGFATIFILVGFVVWAAVAIWYLYRGIRGFLHAVEDRPY